MKSAMSPLPPKKAVALDLLERTSLFVHLDPRRPGVIVPLGFAKQSNLVLQIGLNMAIAIPDLEVGEGGISCTLSFNRRPHFCRLPWSAIYALIGQEGGGMVWPEDVPPEVVAQQRSAAKKDAPARKPALRAVEASADSADRQGARASAEEAAPHAQRSPVRSPEPLGKPEPARKQQGLLRSGSLPPRVVQRSPRLEPGADQHAQRDAELEPAAELASTESTRAPAPELATRPESESVSPASGEKRARPPYLRLVR
jgi:stringent starvation protein B